MKCNIGLKWANTKKILVDNSLEKDKTRSLYYQLTFTCSKPTIETLEKGVKICSKVTVKTPEQRRTYRQAVKIRFSMLIVIEI